MFSREGFDHRLTDVEGEHFAQNSVTYQQYTENWTSASSKIKPLTRRSQLPVFKYSPTHRKISMIPESRAANPGVQNRRCIGVSMAREIASQPLDRPRWLDRAAGQQRQPHSRYSACPRYLLIKRSSTVIFVKRDARCHYRPHSF